MIKNKIIPISVTVRNITHFIKLGYNAKIGQILEIETTHLSSSSHVYIDVICEICKSERKLMYHKYLVNKKRHGFYGCRDCSRQKAYLTSMEKWGVECYNKTDECKERVAQTNMAKFGYKTNLISPEYKEKCKVILKEKYGCEYWYEIRNGNRKNKKKTIYIENIDYLKSEIIYSEDMYDDSILNDEYILYRTECRKLTKRNITSLLDNWSGKDYYDNEDISNNFNLEINNPNYPTIDHKISIYNGFVNNISFDTISSLDNLCITKRSINSKKGILTESEFLKLF